MSTLYEAGAAARMLEVAALIGVADRKIEEAGHELNAAGLGALARQLAKARELHRLAGARVASVLRDLEKGGV